MHFRRLAALSVLTLLVTSACSHADANATASSAPAATSLKEAFRNDFVIGAALNPAQFSERDAKAAALIKREFNTITAENHMKWMHVQPKEGEFTFEQADRFVQFGLDHNMWIVGHTLCWHNQLPKWVSTPPAGQETLTKEVLMERLRTHIHTVAGRYKGKVKGWDVVNEAIEDGTGKLRDSVFMKVIGKEYLVHAFKWAREADPQAELYYNDYNLDQDLKKRAAAIEIVKYLRENGAPIDGVGLQGHYNLTYPPVSRIDETIRLFGELGVKVVVTELDVMVVRHEEISGAVGFWQSNMSKPGKALTAEDQQALADRYREVFEVFRKHRGTVTRVTFWGLRDADSWRRTYSPLIFDDAYQPKPAYHAILSVAAKK